MRIPLKWLLMGQVILSHPGIALSRFHYFDPTLESQIPSTLSATGIYKDISRKIPDDGAIPYEVNTPLWSDGAAKERFLILAPGTHISFNGTGDYYAYPDSTVFVKNFLLDTLPGRPESRILWETRLLINRKKSGYDMWHGLTYKWRKDQSDADLVPEEGLDTVITGSHPGRIADGMSSFPKKWSFPKRNQCRLCHVSIAPGAFGPIRPGESAIRTRSVLGFFTAQLNRPFGGQAADANPLQDLFRKGVFGPSAPPADFTNLPRWRSIEDGSASLGTRARSYLAANCSGCHGTRANLNNVVFGLSDLPNALNYDFHDMAEHMDLGNKELSKDYGSAGRFLVWPGRPDQSALWFRQNQRNRVEGIFGAHPSQMPPLGTYEQDTSALSLLKMWISGMPDRTPDPSQANVIVNTPPAPEVPSALAGKSAVSRRAWATFRDGLIRVETSPSHEVKSSAWLRSLSGSRIPLTRIASDTYRIPMHLRPGLYFLVMAGANPPRRIIIH